MRWFVSGGNTWSRASLPCFAWEGTEGAFYAGWWSAGSYLLALIFKGTVHQILFLVSLKRMFWHFELCFLIETFCSFCALLWRWSISWWYQSKLSYFHVSYMIYHLPWVCNFFSLIIESNCNIISVNCLVLLVTSILLQWLFNCSIIIYI